MTHVAFLRAVNVGGYGLIRMTDLQGAFTGAGCRNVRTFIASGNVLFDAPGGLDAVRPRIQKKVGAILGAEPVIVFRTLRRLQQIVDAAPFGPLAADREVKVYVAFLAERPKRVPRFPLALPKEALEALACARDDVLIVSRRKPNGWYGFPANWIERELGVAATARTWSTVTKIVALGKT